jgi:hypothetical protein
MWGRVRAADAEGEVVVVLPLDDPETWTCGGEVYGGPDLSINPVDLCATREEAQARTEYIWAQVTGGGS